MGVCGAEGERQDGPATPPPTPLPEEEEPDEEEEEEEEEEEKTVGMTAGVVVEEE